MIDLKTIAAPQEFDGSDLICYCFNYTKKDVEQDFIRHGESTILSRVKEEKKNNGCNCEVNNPKGR